MSKEKNNLEITPEDVVVPKELPVIVTGDIVAFPGVLMSLYILEEKNQNSIELAEKSYDNKLLMVSTIKEPGTDFEKKDLPSVGVLAEINRVFQLNDGRIKVLVQGIKRVNVKDYKIKSKSVTATLSDLVMPKVKPNAKFEEIRQKIFEKLQFLIENEQLPEEILVLMEEIDDYSVLSDVIIAHYKLDVSYAQSLLEELDPLKRLNLTYKLIDDDFNSFIIAEQVRSKTQTELSKGQKDYFLREQLRQIQKELGDESSPSGDEDLLDLKKALDKAKLPADAKKESDRQFKRLQRMPVESSEHAVIRTYLEWLADIPWAKKTKEKFNLAKAQEILDDDHYGLKKPKDRILEFLSVRKLKNDSKGPILCFVGPPGVGKTSLGRSIAKALNREFIRISLGGIRDEAEIRGHRRTYVGALPGRIIQGLKEACSRNPVFMLDELDKIGSDYRGDPAAALLEILDPQQNKDFRDHYLNVKFDLSDCLFVATANTLDTIPDALLDRLEIISIPGYTTEEKLNIAKKYLIPRQKEENGVSKKSITFQDNALKHLIEYYTKESGVRGLERQIGSVYRKIARAIVSKETFSKIINKKFIGKSLGKTIFDPDYAVLEDQVGLANGLAWTTVGGEIMPVEVSIAAGSGQLTLTGQLGTVLQESAQAAVFFARANYKQLGLSKNFSNVYDIHIHLPEGATPKDGPSAGITLLSALVSALSGRKIRSEVAMTGEITLRGNVLAIGGLKEKALAALRYGIKKVIIPFDNIKDLDDIPPAQKKKLEFIPVKRAEEVLEIALYPQKKKKKAKKKIVKKSIVRNAP